MNKENKLLLHKVKQTGIQLNPIEKMLLEEIKLLKLKISHLQKDVLDLKSNKVI